MTLTFDEWLVREHGVNHGWTFYEVDAARDAWNASAMIEREACAKVCESFGGNGSGYIDDDWAAMCADAIRAR